MTQERYPRIWNPTTRKYVRAHRVVAEEALGRQLDSGEVVHHLNGDRSDNRPENLQVLPSQAHHMAAEHLVRKLKKGQRALFSLDELLP